MGTSEFAVPTLKALHLSKHEILHAFTTPPSKTGRGHKIQKSPVHLLCEQLALPVSCPKSLRKPEIFEEIKNFGADAIIVASYGKILPESILSICKYGCINIHPSALPRWRGAAPIERTILAGDKTTAVCIMKMDAGIDTGDIYLAEKVKVPKKITAPEFRDQLANLGEKLLMQVLSNIDGMPSQKQTEKGATYAKKLEKEESLINWEDPAERIECSIRAFYSWPGCFFEYKGERIRILAAEVASLPNELCVPGTVLDDQISICCGKGVLKPTMLQRAGKRPLPTKDFLNGFKIKQGDAL